jgi:hypothetical protein
MTATRVMKARRTSTCSLCRGPIKLGQKIAKSGIWAHVECIIERAVALSRR